MRKALLEKAFQFLTKHESFEEIRDESNEYSTFLFSKEDFIYHSIEIPTKGEETIRWYFFDGREGLSSDEGVSLEETDEWFQKLVKRVELSFESVFKNTLSKETDMRAFDWLKAHEFFNSFEENASVEFSEGCGSFEFWDTNEYAHFIDVPKSLDDEMDWYFFDRNEERSYKKREGDSLDKTDTWFRKLVEKAETILDSLKEAKR